MKAKRFVFTPIAGLIAALEKIAKRNSEEDGKTISVSYLMNIILLNDSEVRKEMER